MEVRVLGPVEIVGSTGPVALGGRKRTALVARLALDAGRTLSTELLMEEVWGEAAAPSTVNTLQSHISHIRRRLGPDAGVLVSRPPGYALLVPAEAVDSMRFEGLVRNAREHATSGAPEVALDLLEEAFALWRGRPCSDLAGVEFAEREAARLEELRLSALEDWIDAGLVIGRHAVLTAEIEALLSEHPHRERLAGQLMLALYRSGRQADALRAYQGTRQRLAEELGVEASRPLRDLEAAILRQEPDLDLAMPVPGRPPVATPPPAVEPEVPITGAVQLPPQLTTFIGREAELADGRRLTEGSRLLTLVGSGGCGKTRLAVELSRTIQGDYPGGVYFVDLARVTAAEFVPGAIASTIGFDERQGASIESLASAMEASRLLLVLDNCEHVLDACCDVAEHLLARSPGVRLIATSREQLQVPGESVWRVPSMGLPPRVDGMATREELLASEAVQLFVDRATRAHTGLVLDMETLRSAAGICTRLDGIPLAIELAAGLVGSLPLPEIERRLDQRLRLLSGGTRRRVERQRTLQAAMDWSYDLLDEAERTLFMRLCVFVGEFTLDAAEAVMPRVSGGPDTVHLLVRLVAKSIVSVAEGPGGVHRYRLLETLRQYGLERLAASGDEDLIRVRHARYYAGVAEEAERNIHGPSGAAWLERVERELPNLREAFAWSFGHDELELGVRLTGALRWFFGSMGNLAEARGWLELVLSRRDELSPDLLLIAVTATAMLAWSQGDHTNTAALGEEGVRLAEALDDRQQLANALIVRGAVAVYEGNPERATQCFQRAQGLCEELGDRWANAWLLTCWAVASRRTGALDLAAQQLERALGIFRSLHDERGQVLPLVNLALLAQQQGRLDRAVELATEAVTVATNIGDRQSVHFAVCILGRIELDRGELDRSRDLLIRGLSGFRGAEHTLLVAIALEGMAMICARRGRPVDAVSLWAFAGELRQRSALPVSDERRRERDAELAAARQVLPEDAYERAAAVGRSLTQAEAIDLAVDSSGEREGPEELREPSGAAP